MNEKIIDEIYNETVELIDMLRIEKIRIYIEKYIEKTTK